MQKKNNSLMYSIAVFAFLYSGTIIYSPFYATGDAVISFVLTSIVTLIYSAFTARYFSKRNGIKSKLQAKFFAVIITALAVVPMSSLAADYIRTLGTFADYYTSFFVTVFAAAAMIFCAIYGGSKGRVCVLGFAVLVFWLFIAWTAAGFFAFLTTKNIVPLDAPFKGIKEVDWFALIKNTSYVCLDITLLAAVLCDNESDAVRKNLPRAINRGAAGFVLLSGVNVFKNLLLFGNDFASQIQNPDLAAIRLIPMMDLPEISVIVNSLACVMKMTVYVCLILYALRDSFAHEYCAVGAETAVFSVSGLLCGVFCILEEKNLSSNGIAMICLTFCSLLCYVFFSSHINRQNDIK